MSYGVLEVASKENRFHPSRSAYLSMSVKAKCVSAVAFYISLIAVLNP